MVEIIVLFAVAIIAVVWLVRRAEPSFAFFPFSGEDVTPQRFGVEFTPHTIETADGERLRAWHLPRLDAGAQVVYFHGNGGNLSVWADILVGLWRQGFDIVAIDYRGYGLSTGRPSEQGLYRDVEAAVAFVDGRLRRDTLPLVYWGRSLGASMAAYAASVRAPDGVVLEAGFPTGRSVLETNPLLLAMSFAASYRFPTAAWMGAVKAPALVIHGDRDSVIPYRLGQRLHDALPGPKRFVTIPGGDHNDAEPTDPALYWGAVREFVTSLRHPNAQSPRVGDPAVK
jgi:fermentation-respiration switch protein FrsA (DUF1100 family)